jgi:hypothetical protein
MNTSPPLRALLGFVAAAISVIIFHQGMVAILHTLNLPGMTVAAPFPMQPTKPFGVPLIASLVFWGGLYGVVFGLLAPGMKGAMWVNGIILGVVAALVGFFVVAPIKGNPIGGGFDVMVWARSLLINGFFGLGVGILYPLLVPGRLRN